MDMYRAFELMHKQDGTDEGKKEVKEYEKSSNL
jgi:hypothetical protein